MIPRKIFFTRGIGQADEKLISFENALKDAQIACYNLVRVSSILPVKCEEIPLEEGIKQLTPGQIVYTVISEITFNYNSPNGEKNVFASIGIAKPKDKNLYGYLSEYSGTNRNLDDVKKNSCNLAMRLLQSSRNDTIIECNTSEITAYLKLNFTSILGFITCIAAAVFVE